MNIYKKLSMVMYIYEEIDYNLFLYKKEPGDVFFLVDKANDKEKEYNIESLIIYLQDSPISMVKLDQILNNVLIEQSMYYNMLLKEHLVVLDMTIDEINEMEKELKQALQDLTKTYMSKKLYIVKDPEEEIERLYEEAYRELGVFGEAKILIASEDEE